MSSISNHLPNTYSRQPRFGCGVGRGGILVLPGVQARPEELRALVGLLPHCQLPAPRGRGFLKTCEEPEGTSVQSAAAVSPGLCPRYPAQADRWRGLLTTRLAQAIAAAPGLWPSLLGARCTLRAGSCCPRNCAGTLGAGPGRLDRWLNGPGLRETGCPGREEVNPSQNGGLSLTTSCRPYTWSLNSFIFSVC